MYQDHSSPAYEKFIEQHKADCLSNYTGSSPVMEPHGAIILWKRSLDYNLRYVTFIGDGDSKSYQNVCQEKPYGSEYPVEKSDCIGHVQKRMGTALRKIKKDYRGTKLSDGCTIEGAGRLTETLCDDFQNYYGQAIRNNVGDLEGIKNAVKAILQHSMSTDENPMHAFCPEGENSWCKFQRASALGLMPPAHRTTIPKAVGEVIAPIFDRLGDKSLLERYLKGNTQNPNESLLHWYGPAVQRNRVLNLGLLSVLCSW